MLIVPYPGYSRIAVSAGGLHSANVESELASLILAAIERAPQWVRHDLGSKDQAVRCRAEETLAAMVANALAVQAGQPTSD